MSDCQYETTAKHLSNLLFVVGSGVWRQQATFISPKRAFLEHCRCYCLKEINDPLKQAANHATADKHEHENHAIVRTHRWRNRGNN